MMQNGRIMELTRTGAVFSRTTVMLFLCRNKSSPNVAKLFDDFWNKRGTRSFVGGPEGEGGGHHPPGRARGLARVLVEGGPLEAHLRVKPTPKNPINAETPRNNPRSKVPPPKPL